MKTNRRGFISKSVSVGLGLPLMHYANAYNSESTSALKSTLIYSNPLSSPSDLEDFIIEGQATLSFPNHRLRMQNTLPVSEGRRAHFVAWCTYDFPSDIKVEWEFYPIEEPGLCMTFFAAKGVNGKDIFDESLSERNGIYPQYHSGDINTYHLSYFRRKHPDERSFHTCNLRKSKGFELVAMGADPIPSVPDTKPPYKISLTKFKDRISFSINRLEVLNWTDNQSPLSNGKLGFRQMAPLVAEYQNLNVYALGK